MNALHFGMVLAVGEIIYFTNTPDCNEKPSRLCVYTEVYTELLSMNEWMLPSSGDWGEHAPEKRGFI